MSGASKLTVVLRRRLWLVVRAVVGEGALSISLGCASGAGPLRLDGLLSTLSPAPRGRREAATKGVRQPQASLSDPETLVLFADTCRKIGHRYRAMITRA
jgi:hypothetical protein